LVKKLSKTKQHTHTHTHTHTLIICIFVDDVPETSLHQSRVIEMCPYYENKEDSIMSLGGISASLSGIAYQYIIKIM
jgi:hypothetical protein